MALSQKTMSGTVGTTKQVTATLTPDGASGDIAATSSDTSIATVAKNSNGSFTVSLVAAGSATITFAAGDVTSTLAATVSAAS
ncbi:MAG: Ig-like domain-containing protein [Liquorilactobacillus nagelii]|uniref:Ig-like domain-containing protein n=1 Tax=Liquorilactobacillus nagelii TaxID=82688 RepID=UPI0039E9F70B